MNSVSGLYLTNENSNGQTQAEYMTSGIRSVSHTLQEKPKLSYLSFPRVRRLGCFLKRRFSPASTPYKWHICGNYNMTWADNSPKLRDLRTTDTYPIGLNSAYWLWTIRPFVCFFFPQSILFWPQMQQLRENFLEPWPLNMMVHYINSYYSPKRVLHEQSVHLQWGYI